MGALNKKPMATVGLRMAHAIEALSKNTLADMLVDEILKEIGEDATDEQIAQALQSRVDIIARMRGDKPVKLQSRIDQWDRYQAKYKAEHTSE